MDELKILKYRLGINTTVRDDYLTAIIKGIESELKNIQGIEIGEPGSRADDISMFIIDYAEFRYTNRGENKGIPEHLKFRLRNLYTRRR